MINYASARCVWNRLPSRATARPLDSAIHIHLRRTVAVNSCAGAADRLPVRLKFPQEVLVAARHRSTLRTVNRDIDASRAFSPPCFLCGPKLARVRFAVEDEIARVHRLTIEHERDGETVSRLGQVN